METLLKDLRYTFRSLRNHKGVTAVILSCLALGIGANTAIFSVVNSVLLRPLPVRDEGRVVTLQDRYEAPGAEPEIYDVSPPNFAGWQERNQVFEDMAAVYMRSFNLVGDGGGDAVRIEGASVSWNLFDLIGAKPVRGRTFRPNEDLPDAPARIVLISHTIWQRQFGGDPDIVGRTLKLDGLAYEVVGIMPPGFQFPQRPEHPIGAHFWEPLGLDPDKLPNRNWHNHFVLARLKPGVTLEGARAGMESVSAQLARDFPDTNNGWSAEIVPLRDRLVGNARPVLLALLGAVGFILLMACTNVASLLLARTVGRGQEIAVRTALGASPGVLVRQLLTESLVLAFLGAVLGLGLAALSVPLLVRLSPGDVPNLDRLGMDWRVLAFTLGLATLTGLLFGLVPAVKGARSDVYRVLRQGGGKLLGGVEGRRLQNALVVVQIALVVTLLVGAGLTLKSLRRLQQVDPGFEVANRLTLKVWLSEAQYPEVHQRAAYFRDVVDRVSAVPGVIAAGGSTTLPVADPETKAAFLVEGREPSQAGEVFFTNHRRVRPGYFKAMGIRLLQGRLLDERDSAEAPRVVVISKAMAERFWPGEDPLGRRVKRGWSNSADLPWITVVGVVEDVHDVGLDKDPEPAWYLPDTQHDTEYMSLVVHTASDPAGLIPAVRQAIRSVDREQPIFRIATLAELVSGSMSRQRFGAVLLTLFAGLGILLAAVGVYGVMSYTVSQLFHEIGLRMALGADRGAVLRLLLRQGMTLAVLGVALGLGGAVLLTRLLSSLLFGVSPTDPATLFGAAVFLGLVALLATWVPARRVSRIDPLIALRYQ